MKIKYRIVNIISNIGAPWFCHIYGDKPNSPNLWFGYKTRGLARNKLKIFKKEINVAWFNKAMK